VFHQQFDWSAVEIDEMMAVHARASKLADDRKQAEERRRHA
jgi:hypothetical protein